MSGKIKPIETERLLLREIRELDASLIVQWRADPEVYQYFLLPKPVTKKEHLNWYFNCYKEDDNRIDFMAVEKISGKEKGIFNIKRNVSSAQYAEIGYLLDKSVQRKGYAQEGIKRLMNYAKDEWKCKGIVFHIHEENKASRALAEKLGYAVAERRGKFILYQKSLENIPGGGINLYKIYTGKEAA